MSNEHPQNQEGFAAIGKLVIENIAKNSGFNAANLKQEKPLPIVWVVVPVISYFVICAFLLWVLDKGTKSYLFIFIVGILSTGWVAGAAHKKADSKTITTIIGLAAFVGLLIAARITTPEDTAKKTDQYFQDKKNNGK